MEITAKITGADTISYNLGQKANATPALIEQVITLVAMRLRDVMVQNAQAGHPDHPNVISGQLSGKITYKVDPAGTKTVGYVGSPTPYAPYVEFGHTQQPGRFVPALGKRLVQADVKPYPFVRPAVTQVFDGGEAQQILENTVSDAMQ